MQFLDKNIFIINSICKVKISLFGLVLEFVFSEELKSPQWLRDLKFKKRPFFRIDKYRLNNILTNGGWHFCNLKTSDKLKYKYENLCETNDPVVFNEKIDDKYLNEEMV